MAKRSKYGFWSMVLFAALFAVFAVQKTPGLPIQSERLEVTFVDVGQGDCVFIKTPDGKTCLIDGGEDELFTLWLQPFLRERGIDKVDCAVVSHYHSDHAGGILELTQRGGADGLVIPNYNPDNKMKDELLKAAGTSLTEVREVSKGDSLDIGDDNLKISVLHPQANGFSEEENDNSLVLKLSYFNTEILLTGDLEELGEATISELDIEADIMKIGHHGSSTSTSVKLLEAADPTFGVIQCGRDNKYGHPHYETLEALENNDVRVYRTDLDGNVTFLIGKDGIDEVKVSRK